MDSEKNIEVHLGFIQNVITRMGQNSFQAKAWCVTVVSALTAFFFSSKSHASCVIGIVAAVLFCLLDSYYLYLERGYRSLYNIAAGLVDKKHVNSFDMSIPKECRGFQKYLKALCSVSTGVFYLALIIGMSLILIFE